MLQKSIIANCVIYVTRIKWIFSRQRHWSMSAHESGCARHALFSHAAIAWLDAWQLVLQVSNFLESKIEMFENQVKKMLLFYGMSFLIAKLPFWNTNHTSTPQIVWLSAVTKGLLLFINLIPWPMDQVQIVAIFLGTPFLWSHFLWSGGRGQFEKEHINSYNHI